MTSLCQEQRQSAPEYTAEDVERLASFMGWEPISGAQGAWWNGGTKGARYGYEVVESREKLGYALHHGAFLPFTDARHDLEVLERAREKDDDFAWKVACEVHRVWNARNTGGHGTRFMVISYLMYEAGDYSRAVLEVLRSTSQTGE